MKQLNTDRLRIVLGTLYVAGVAVFAVWLWLGVFKFDLPLTAWLKSETARWESKVDLLDRNLEAYEDVLSGVEARNNGVYRSIFGLDAVPGESQSSELKRLARFAPLESKGANAHFLQTAMRLDRMSKRASVQSRALDEVALVSRNADEMISCVPAVMPLVPKPGKYRLSSGFGLREDPVSGRGTFHRGQDFAAKRGTPVYATGDGVVELSDSRFRGYGNVIVINHGFGYKSVYAHLNTIEVKDGMKVSRGERIGSVGNTGKSTGPHLHYEVHYKGQQVNPAGYYDTSMPVREYEDMIRRREAESPRGKMSTFSELMNRRSTEGDAH